MIHKWTLLCLLAVCCASNATPQALEHSPRKINESALSTPADRKVSVCALLTSTEIEAVQGEPVKKTKSTLQLADGMTLLQCVFLTPTAAKSVSLEVATVNHSNSPAATPRKFWRNQFHSLDLKEKELPGDAKPAKSSAAEDEKEEVNEPRRIGGVGEEAYWVGSPVTGMLYVLKGDIFLRISLGGLREESARLEKSKALARAAMRRL